MTSRWFVSAIVFCFLCQLTAVASTDFDDGRGQPSNRVEVRLFYETHCPYSRQFITSQLWPVYLKLSDRLDVDLVPYGMALKREFVDADGRRRTEISCQHGRNECVANMIQACAVSLYSDTYQLLAYVVCMESSENPHRVAKSCSSRVGISWSALEHCMTTRTGHRLLLMMGHKTASHRPAVPYVPFVVVNGRHGEEVQRRAVSDFLGVVCFMFAEPVPPACLSRQRSQRSEVKGAPSAGLLDMQGLNATDAAHSTLISNGAFRSPTPSVVEQLRVWKECHTAMTYDLPRTRLLQPDI
ncbi:hypothetical protein MRX96_012676 [Rhipicephalus microplus]